MRKFGQHFLIDPFMAKKMVESCRPEGQVVVEIGAGLGALTLPLSEKAKKVVALEIDRKLASLLRRKVANRKNVEVVIENALIFDYAKLGKITVIGNLPFYLSSPLLFRFVELKEHILLMVLTLQREVAERVISPPGRKDYGVLSVFCQLHFEVELLFTIPPESFRPPPKVEAAVVRFVPLENPKVEGGPLFEKVVRTSFALRRKTLRNALKELFPAAERALQLANIDPRRRGETLSLEEFARLSQTLQGVAQGS